MTDQLQTDPAVMEGLASTLRHSATTMASVGGSVPDTPDAGEVSADMAVVLSQLVAATAELVSGVTAAGDALASGGAEYAESEQTNRRSFDGPR
ncbi:MAG: hypothetical protein M3257_09385 [Actinomycetota bacterium]|nr:hypothetical protein [Actinomycetota bacterium]